MNDEAQKSAERIPMAFRKLYLSKGFASIDELSVAAGASPSTLRKAVTRDHPRRVQSDTLSRAAKLLGVPMDQLAVIMDLTGADADFSERPAGTLSEAGIITLRDSADMPLIPGRRPLLVEHRVQAGMWVEEDDFTQDRLNGPPIYANPNFPRPQWLELVSGNSVDRIAPDGAFVHVVDWAGIDRDPRDGEVVVIKRTRLNGVLCERSVKRVRKTGKSIEFWPDSTDARWNQPLALGDGDDDITVQVAGLVIGVYRSAL